MKVSQRVATSSHQAIVADTKVTTMMDFSLTSGILCYAQIAALNSVGLGPYDSAKPAAERTRFQPELAHNCYVCFILCVSMLVE